jgi:hypothetical protein
MAGFPTTGLKAAEQTSAGVRDACSDLDRLAAGDLVVIRGGGIDHEGRVVEAGVTLNSPFA